jgi:hypothetical protein
VGLIGVARDHLLPPDNLIGALYDRLRPGHRENSAHTKPTLSPEQEKALVEKLRSMEEGPPPSSDADLLQGDKTVTYKRMVPHRRGRFHFLPRKVLEKDKSSN